MGDKLAKVVVILSSGTCVLEAGSAVYDAVQVVRYLLDRYIATLVALSYRLGLKVNRSELLSFLSAFTAPQDSSNSCISHNAIDILEAKGSSKLRK